MFQPISQIIDRGLDARLYSGAAIGIARGSDTLYTGYYGHTSFDDDAEAIGHGTLFDLASVTKIASTTLIALRFLDRGLLRLEDKVSDYFAQATEARDITIRQLMTHTSGEPAHFLIADETETPEGIRELLLHRPLAARPGETEAYSCIGFILLGEILKTIGGKPLDTLFRDEVTGPLQLSTMQYGPIDGPHVAQTRDLSTGTILQGVVHDENARFQHGISANAGLFSNVGDLLIIAKMLAAKGKSPARPYLSPAVLRTAVQNYTPGMAEDRGLGFFLGSNRGSSLGDLAGNNSFGHTGFTGTSLAVVPEYDLSIVFLSNRVLSEADSRETVRLRANLHNAIVAEVSKQG